MTDYERGLNDAWEAVKEFFGDYVICLDDREKLTKNEVAEKYRLGTRLCKSISLLESFFDAGPEYAIESLQLWKEKAEEIQVGDEVQIISDGTKGVVTMKNGEFIEGMIDAMCGFRWYKKDIQKTGRHFPEVAELLRKMQQVKEDENAE